MEKEQGSKHPTKKPFIGRRLTGTLGLVGSIVILLVAGTLFGMNQYLQSNKAKIIDNLPFLHEGAISFEKVSVGIFNHFPSATVSLENVVVQDSMFVQHENPLLKLRKIDITLSVRKLVQGKVEIKSAELYRGEINIFTNTEGYNNLKSILKQSKAAGNLEEEGMLSIHPENLSIALTNVSINYADSLKKTYLRGLARRVVSQVGQEDSLISLQAGLSLGVEELTFNQEKGSFLVDSDVNGNVAAKLRGTVLDISPSYLLLNDEGFLVSGEIYPKKEQLSTLIFENSETDYDKIMPLLPDPLQKNIKPYQVAGNFYSNTKITGTFTHGENPIVDIELRMPDNDLLVQEYLFEDAVLDARLVNRFYDDSRAGYEGRNKIRLEIREFESRHRGFAIHAQEGVVYARKGLPATITIGAHISGKASEISEWLESDQFFFGEGDFTLHAEVNGPLNNMRGIIVGSDAELVLDEVAVIYKPANTAFPVKQISLIKKAGDADFTLLSSTFTSGNDYRLKGGLYNLAALLIELNGQRANSKVLWVADKISWQDFVDLFGQDGSLKNKQPKTDRQKKKSMKETVAGIQETFQPQISIFIDTIDYDDKLQLYNFSTGVHFEDEHTLVLEETRFHIGRGLVDLTGRMDIRDPHTTPFEFSLRTQNLNLQEILPPLNYFNIKLLANLDSIPQNINISIKHKGVLDDVKGFIPNTSTGEIVFEKVAGNALHGKIKYQPSIASSGRADSSKSFVNTQLELTGDPFIFNEFFDNEEFFFEKGSFHVAFDYEGDVASVEQLLNEGRATFSMEGSEVYYKSVDLSFPFSNVDIKVSEDTADFDVLVYSDSLGQELQFIGEIDNLSELVIGNTGKNFKANVDIYSPKLVWNDFLGLFAAQQASMKPQARTSHALKETVKGILNTFDPSLSLKADTFVYSQNLFVENVETGIHLVDSNRVSLDKSGFAFYDGSVSLNGTIDIGEAKTTPFEAQFHTEDLDVARLLEGLDYFSIPALQEVEKLEGRITSDLYLSSEISEDGKRLVPEATQGVLDFKLQNVELQGLSVIDSLAIKFKKRKRFKTLRFAPISNQLIISGKEIKIPLMEVQSNVLNMFVEGKVSLEDSTNVWLSIPWSNLKKPDPNVIPPMRGYAATPNKLYVEIGPGEEGKIKFDVHLNKMKFYEDRGIVGQYKIDKKRRKEERKAMKRQQAVGVLRGE